MSGSSRGDTQTNRPLNGEVQGRFKPYPKYKDSGIEWLGPIPEHWEILKLKFLANTAASNVDKKSYEGEREVKLCNYVDVYNNEYITPDMDFMKATATIEEIRRFRLRDRDVLVTKDSEDWRDIAVPAYIPYVDSDNVLSGYHLALIRPRNAILDGEYLFRLLSSPSVNYQYRLAATGITRYGLSRYWLDNSLILRPPIEEQGAIAKYLKVFSSNIDNLVRKKQDMIVLLKEKRASLINQAVTKGLDPNVPMKDSGIEELGDIPARWEMRRIAMSVNKITNGYVGPTRDIFVGEGVPYLQSLHIKEGKIEFGKRPYYISEGWSLQHKKSILNSGDVLVVQTGDIGQVAVVTGDFDKANCHALIILRMRPELGSGKYLCWIFQSDYGKNALRRSQTGALHPHLECGHVREIRIPLPPVHEQENIIRAIEQTIGDINALICKIEQAVDRLKEYRSTLITVAVTGKIDVRGE